MNYNFTRKRATLPNPFRYPILIRASLIRALSVLSDGPSKHFRELVGPLAHFAGSPHLSTEASVRMGTFTRKIPFFALMGPQIEVSQAPEFAEDLSRLDRVCGDYPLGAIALLRTKPGAREIQEDRRGCSEPKNACINQANGTRFSVNELQQPIACLFVTMLPFQQRFLVPSHTWQGHGVLLPHPSHPPSCRPHC